MIGGQMLDLELKDGCADANSLAGRDLKTVALMRLMMTASAIAVGADEADTRVLSKFGECSGRAYQICDDLLDEVGNHVSGKTAGQDARHGRASADDADARAISILIPARDEESNIAACLKLALAQGSVVREVLVYDDHSTDATPRIVEKFARRDSRVRLLAPEPLPARWCGKTFACAQLAAAAGARWLIFLDADARLHVDAVRRVLKEAEARNVTLLSCWPALELVGFWERVLMPLLNFVVFTLYPAPLALRRADASLGLAHGSFILARGDAYLRTGGHALVRAELFEDTRLAQAWRARGERSLCLDGQSVLSLRMYRSFGEIWMGFQKNIFPAFRRARSFWSFVALRLSLFLLPFALLPLAVKFQGGWLCALPALCVLLMRLALAVRFRQPWWSVLLHPLSESVLLALGISSWLRCRGGRGVEWKGRRYHSGARV